MNAALRRLGYAHDEMTGHGFRSMASTLINEQGWHPDLIELQLDTKPARVEAAASPLKARSINPTGFIENRAPEESGVVAPAIV